MGPSEIEELVTREPFIPLRLTLASGDIVELRDPEGIGLTGMSISVEDISAFGRPRLRLVSIPNIVMVEPLAPSPAGNRSNDDR